MNIYHPTPTQLKKYPHMSPVDIEVWQHFLNVYPNLFHNLAYDVRVGTGIPPANKYQSALERDWKMLTQKRIDAAAFHDDKIYIIELKGTATVSAPGQVLAYTILYKHTFKPTRILQPVLIYHYASPDIERIAENLSVKTFHVYF